MDDSNRTRREAAKQGKVETMLEKNQPNRNSLLARSIYFGMVAKISGAIVVFLALPMLAARLEQSAYARFLQEMTSASGVTLLFGISSLASVQLIARAMTDKDESKSAELISNLIGMFLTIFLLICSLLCAGTCALWIAKTALPGTLIVATSLACLHGLLLFGDSYRVATRGDHLTSSLQTLANLFLILSIAFGPSSNIWYVTIIYFGTPVVVNFLISASAVVPYFPHIRPKLGIGALIKHIDALGPASISMTADYSRTFASTFIISLICPAEEYAKIATIFIVVARLVNPLSVFTRPFLPALVDAISQRDSAWLKRARKQLRRVTLLGLCSTGISAIVLWHALEGARGGNWYSISASEGEFGLLLLIAQAAMNLSAPIFYARSADARLYAKINAISAIIGILFGTVLTFLIGPKGMLIGISLSIAGAALMYLRAADSILAGNTFQMAAA